MGIRVSVQDGRVEMAMKKLKKMLLKEGQHRDLARHKYYTSPSERRRLRDRKSRTKRLRAAAKV